jgi:putative hydrolase of the HAD superfamily
VSAEAAQPVRPAIGAVLFDYGGVISDGPFVAFERYERMHGLPAGFIRTINATNPLDNAWARFERSEITFDEFRAAFSAEARAAGSSVDARELFTMFGGAPRPEMVEAVRRCQEHFKTGLLTNNFVSPFAGERDPMMEELRSAFDAVVESSVVGVRKPDERFYLIACEALGVTPDRSVFLDDLGVNLKPARALGMVTIKVVDTERALDELEGVLGIALRAG